MITIDSKVKHEKLGIGIVDAVKPDFAIVTFENGDTLKCPFDELTEMEDINSAIQKAPHSTLFHQIKLVNSGEIVLFPRTKEGLLKVIMVDAVREELCFQGKAGALPIYSPHLSN